MSQFKNCYPQNVGQIYRNYVHFFGFGLVAFILGNIYPYTNEEIYSTIMGAGIMAFGMNAIGTQIFKDERWQLRSKIKKTKQELNNFAHYPDIKNYIDKFNKELIETRDEKDNLSSIFYKRVAIVVAICILLTTINLLYCFKVYQPRETHKLVGFKLMNTTELISQQMNLSNTKPLFSLKPLRDGIGDNKSLDFYIDNKGNSTVLKTVNPTNYNDTIKNVFRLTLTDQNGNAINQIPIFEFSACDNDTIYSQKILPYIYSKPAYVYETKHLLTNLQTHQSSIFYTIEKIE